MRKINVSDLPTTQAHNKVSRKALVKVGDMKSSIQTVNDALLKPEEGFEPHRHIDGEEIYYFLEGSGIMQIEGNDFDVKYGDCIIIEVGESHGLKNNSTKLLRFITIRSSFQ